MADPHLHRPLRAWPPWGGRPILFTVRRPGGRWLQGVSAEVISFAAVAIQWLIPQVFPLQVLPNGCTEKYDTSVR